MSSPASISDRDVPIPVIDGPLSLRIWRGVRDPLHFLSSIEAKFGDIATLREGKSYAIFHPDYIRHVLQDNHPNYAKGPKYRAALSPLMGNGLFTSEGSFWLRQRRLAQGAFQHHHLENVSAPVVNCVSEMFASWSANAKQNKPVALREELTELTLRIAFRNLFGTDADIHLKTLVPAINTVNESINLASAFIPVHLPKWIPTPGRRRFQSALHTIDEFIYGLVKERRAHREQRTDLMGLLLQARDEESNAQMDDLQLRDELVTMLNAGHDTVTDSLVWTLIALAQHPEYRQQAQSEVRRVLGDKPPTPATIREMPFLARVFHESLRLNPPGWAFARTAAAEDRIGPHRIPAGGLVVMSPYVVHRSPRYWDRPEVFDPDRFLPQNSEGRRKFVYFPFGAGPRKCIGAGLVELEAPMILAAILQKFDFHLSPETVITAAPRISLRPKSTVWLHLRQDA